MRSHIPKSGELSGTLKRIEDKIDLLIDKAKIEHQAKKRKEAVELGGALDIATLLSLPDHLRKSAMAIMKLGRAMAEDVAKETGRARAIESAYLNQLARMGHVKKGKEGRRVYFSVEENQTNVEYLLKEKVATVVER
jgi:predicted transcriptional regulator